MLGSQALYHHVKFKSRGEPHSLAGEGGPNSNDRTESLALCGKHSIHDTVQYLGSMCTAVLIGRDR